MTLKIEIVTDSTRFGIIRQSWQELWDRSGGFIFQHHDWIAGWLDGIRDRRDIKLHIALAWEGDRLCAAMPCAVHRRSGLRVLVWAAQLFSDYCDCLVDSAYKNAGPLPLLWDELRQSGGFDLVSLQQIRPDAKCRTFFDRLAGDGTQLQHADRAERCMRIESHWSDGESFFRSLNKKARNNHTRGKRILTELAGEVRFRFEERP